MTATADKPREWPLIFQGWGVRAIIDGRKTMTRRVDPKGRLAKMAAGDRIWVKETIRLYDDLPGAYYVADGSQVPIGVWERIVKIPHVSRVLLPMFMYRWASRITLEVVEVRDEPLQSIRTIDAIAEGMGNDGGGEFAIDGMSCAQVKFMDVWDSLAKPGNRWADNPTVKVITFRRIEP